MNYQGIIDLHTHTERSFDGHFSADKMCEEAVKKGIKTLAITDHLEMYAYYRDSFDETARLSFADVAAAREKYAGRLEVLAGAEMGETVYDETIKTLSGRVAGQYDYDIVIGAVHNLPDRDDFYYMDFSGESDFYPLLDEYFFWELETAKWGGFDTLAHLTYPLRYITGKYGREVDMSRYSGIIDEILLTLINNNKALELNTAGFRQPIGEPSPNEEVIARYRQLGGKYLTVGSDAHYTEHLGSGIPDAFDIALRCGFREITVFRKREPFLIPIE